MRFHDKVFFYGIIGLMLISVTFFNKYDTYDLEMILTGLYFLSVAGLHCVAPFWSADKDNIFIGIYLIIFGIYCFLMEFLWIVGGVALAATGVWMLFNEFWEL